MSAPRVPAGFDAEALGSAEAGVASDPFFEGEEDAAGLGAADFEEAPERCAEVGAFVPTDFAEGSGVGVLCASGFSVAAGSELGISAPIPRPRPRFFAMISSFQFLGSGRREISCAAARYARAPVLLGS